MEEGETRTLLFPNLFYDIIVFLTPTLTASVGLGLGLGWLDDAWQAITTGEGGTLSVVVISLLVFFLGYEYGRLAETFSDVLVAMPIRLLRKTKIVFAGKDFNRSLSPQVKALGIDEALFDGRASSKWSLYFYAMQRTPLIGADLLKRYAWEKLARSEGFSFFMLAAISLGIHVSNWLLPSDLFRAPGEFGSNEYLAGTGILYVLCLVDYYKRNAWNCDLLITTIPIVVDEVRRRAAVQRVLRGQEVSPPKASVDDGSQHPKPQVSDGRAGVSPGVESTPTD